MINFIKKFLPINLTSYNKNVVNGSILFKYRFRLNQIPALSERLRKIAYYYSNNHLLKDDIFYDNQLFINNLEHTLHQGLNLYKTYYFVNNKRLDYHNDLILTLERWYYEINAKLVIMEKMMQKPRGQRFCPADPFGEEIWED